MPQLPQDIDFGPRPGLRTNRLDQPSRGGLEIADSVAQATDTFVQIYSQHKQKTDRLNYNLAKQEIIKADIEERQRLVDDQDFDTYDERYRNAVNERRDEIVARYGLDPDDDNLLGAESDVLIERGAAAVGNRAREGVLDRQKGELMTNLDNAREAVLVAEDAETANEIMLTQLDGIGAGEEAGLLTDVEARDMRQKFVQDTATARLITMDPQLREKLLEQSLTARKTNGAITEEDIRAGKGTGSIADFVHGDTATKMLRATKDENEIENTQAIAFGASDAAWAAHPEPEQAAERESLIKDMTKDDPKARKEALILSSQRTTRSSVAESQGRAQSMVDLMGEIDGGETFNTLSAAARAGLTVNERNALEEYSRNRHERDGFSDFTTWEAQDLWDTMSDQERAATDLNGFMHRDQENATGDNIPWATMVTREKMDLMSAQRRAGEQRIKSGSAESGLTQSQLLTETLLQTPYFDHKPTRSDSQEQQDRWSRIATAYDRALVSEGQGGKLTPVRRREILGEVMRHEVFVRESFARDDKFPLPALSSDQVKNAYIPLDQQVSVGGQQVNAHSLNVKIDNYSGPAYTWLVNVGKSLDPDNEVPDDDDLEEAWFYLVTQGPDAAKARLAGQEGL